LKPCFSAQCKHNIFLQHNSLNARQNLIIARLFSIFIQRYIRPSKSSQCLLEYSLRCHIPMIFPAFLPHPLNNGQTNEQKTIYVK